MIQNIFWIMDGRKVKCKKGREWSRRGKLYVAFPPKSHNLVDLFSPPFPFQMKNYRIFRFLKFQTHVWRSNRTREKFNHQVFDLINLILHIFNSYKGCQMWNAEDSFQKQLKTLISAILPHNVALVVHEKDLFWYITTYITNKFLKFHTVY